MATERGMEGSSGNCGQQMTPPASTCQEPPGPDGRRHGRTIVMADTFHKEFPCMVSQAEDGKAMQSARSTAQETRAHGEDLVLTDPLTGLGNTRRFFDKVNRLISDRADDPAPFAISVLDLDGFKPINDLFGRIAGDEILQQVAMRLRAAMDEHSTVTRIGADEFAVLYPMVFSEEAAAEKAKMLIEILSAPYDVGFRTARLSASAGCSLFYSEEDTAELLLSKAETALYQAKRAGRGVVVVYTREMEEAAKRVTRIEQALRRAVAAGEVEPHFQPIVDLSTRRIVGFETLARWTDRDLGAISP